MPIQPFSAQDFAVFELPGFAERMAAIRTRIRPKLETIGATLTPALTRIARTELYAHVARHARRTVNPPDDTWVAFGPDKRGYKQAAHFKVAISRRSLRLLFELGREYPTKAEWVRAWKQAAPRLHKRMVGLPGLGWYKDEHDEEPAAAVGALDLGRFKALADELVRTRDGQFVLGRRIDAREAARWRGPDYEQAALDTFAVLGEGFQVK
jgi:uncharacterized protein YktB (UPF0637 family)